MMQTLFKSVYGSHLYGTNTPTSDTDYKVVYLPSFDDVLLGKKLSTFKTRFDAEGNPVEDNAVMPDGGVETEHVPFQTFARDFVGGQTYALELVYATPDEARPDWMRELAHFANSNVKAMAGFAMKQTFDYVRRGERLDAARTLKAAVLRAQNEVDAVNASRDKDEQVRWRLDGVLPNGRKVLHVLAEEAGVELGTTVNNNRTMETLKLNGRDYLETTDLGHLLEAVEKLIASYGHRTRQAALEDVDLKSLMHAVRVYEQALELLATGKMTFPRPNREELLAVKRGENLDEVKEKLRRLDDELEAAMKREAAVPAPSIDLNQRFERWLLLWLWKLYDLR